MQYMSSKQIARRKEVRDDGSIVEIVIWQLPEPLLPCKHCYKYRLAYVIDGECVMRYDNEQGKGDHKHFGVDESPYLFTSLDDLLRDFRRDVENWK